MEKTLLIIKPDAVRNRHVGKIIAVLEEKSIVIRNMKMMRLTKELAEGFYEIHRNKPFYEELVEFMISGPVIVMVLEHDNCVKYIREIIGNTNPEAAAEGTIRRLFAESMTFNAVHASDSNENAEKEIYYMFGDSQTV